MSRRRSAFTLMEVLVSIALFGVLLAAAVTILVQVSAAYVTEAEDPVADRHADGLERFLRRVIAESGASGLTAPTQEQISEEGAVLAVSPPADLPFFEPLEKAGGLIEARLAIPSDGGLWLYWNARSERRLGLAQAHRTRLSPWVTSAKVYLYDDTDKVWSDVEPGESVQGVGNVGSASVLRVLRVEIVRMGRVRTVQIPLPRSAS